MQYLFVLCPRKKRTKKEGIIVDQGSNDVYGVALEIHLPAVLVTHVLVGYCSGTPLSTCIFWGNGYLTEAFPAEVAVTPHIQASRLVFRMDKHRDWSSGWTETTI
jgi:hypothetical protein